MSQQRTKIQNAIEEKKGKLQAKRLIGEMKSTRTRAHEQMKKEYYKIQEAEKNKDAKKWKMACRSFKFFSRMCEMSDRFIECFEQIERASGKAADSLCAAADVR